MKFAAEPTPFQPENIEAMVARWSQVLATTYDLDKIKTGEQMSPVFQRQHVFDFPDGIRIIASVDKLEAEPAQLHISLGIHSDSHPTWLARGHRAWLQHCTRLVIQFMQRGLITGELVNAHTTAKAVHYWFTL